MVNRKSFDIFNEGISRQLAELPQFSVGDDALHGKTRIAVDFLRRDQFRQTLSPALLKIIFFRFGDHDQRRFQHGFAQC